VGKIKTETGNRPLVLWVTDVKPSSHYQEEKDSISRMTRRTFRSRENWERVKTFFLIKKKPKKKKGAQTEQEGGENVRKDKNWSHMIERAY